MNKLLATFALLTLSMACSLGAEPPPGPDGGDPICDEPGAPTYANFGGPFLTTNCTSCHATALPAGQRQGAPVGINFDEGEAILDQVDRIMARTVDDQTMPPAARTSDAERERLELWLGCGAPGAEDATPPPANPNPNPNPEPEPEPEPEIGPLEESTPEDPSALTVEFATLTEGVQLNWVDNAEGEFAMVMQRCEGAGCTNFANTFFFEGDAHDHMLDPLIESGKTYRYRVYVVFPDPVTQIRVSGASNIVEAVLPEGEVATFNFAPGESSEADPGDLSVELVTDGAMVRWSDNSDNEVGFVVEACAGAECTDFAMASGTDADITEVFMPLEPGAVVNVRVYGVTFTPEGFTGTGATAPALVEVPAA